MIIINKQIGSPTNPSLLGLNVGGGVNVKLRLRRPNRDWDFFPFDQVLDTMALTMPASTCFGMNLERYF